MENHHPVTDEARTVIIGHEMAETIPEAGVVEATTSIKIGAKWL
jgi:hypothetical protein